MPKGFSLPKKVVISNHFGQTLLLDVKDGYEIVISHKMGVIRCEFPDGSITEYPMASMQFFTYNPNEEDDEGGDSVST